MIYIGVMGHGTVGSGVVEILQKNYNTIAQRAGDELVVKKILDLKSFDVPYNELFTKDADDLLEDDDIDIIVETMGGIDPAYEFTVRALKSGKHVITSNKELVAQHGTELLRIARENNVNYLFEASVGGGIPIIRPLKQCLAANQIWEIYGILNGTTNYILTRMKKAGLDFDEALEEAKTKGYAEQDPTADIEGHDAGRKIAILSSIAFESHVPYEKVYTEGIVDISHIDILYAEKLEHSIKLIARAKKSGDGIFAMVNPTLISNYSPLADVEDVFNAIMVKGDAIGDVMFYGQGAGKLPTASAVVGDIIDAAKHLKGTKKEPDGNGQEAKVLPADEYESKFFIRLKSPHIEELKEAVSDVFPGSTVVSLDDENTQYELAVVTPLMNKRRLEQLLANISEKIDDFEFIKSIRVE
ncbi:MAG TPA: homoserine dehydrogenase [Clostridiales bacterium]|nr:homoserine dehydrogenase [Clostridiales bacterium]